MKINTGAIADEIIAEAKKQIKKDIKAIGKQAKKDFLVQSQLVAYLYYTRYTPRKYERTHNLLDNVVDDSMLFSSFGGDSVNAGISFNASGMSDYEDGSSYAKHVVVDNFMEGIHGKKSIQQDSRNALVLMEEFQQNYKKTLDRYFAERGYTIE